MSEEKICDLTRSLAFLVFSCVADPSARLPARERHSRETDASSLTRPRRRRQVQVHFPHGVRAHVVVAQMIAGGYYSYIKIEVLQVLDHLRLELRLAGLEVRAEAVGIVFFS